MPQALPERRFIARILSLTGPELGWRPGDRLVVLVPVDLFRGGEWQQLEGELRVTKRPRPLPVGGGNRSSEHLAWQMEIAYEVENACDWESAYAQPEGSIYQHLWVEQVPIWSEPGRTSGTTELLESLPQERVTEAHPVSANWDTPGRA